MNPRTADVQIIDAPVGDVTGTIAAAVERPEPISILRRSPGQHPRAQRRAQVELPSLSTVRFPWGDARLLNISNTGLLFESGTRIPPGSCQRLTLCGPGVEIQVPACFVRSEVALVNGLGVKYHIAVMFERPLELDAAPSDAQAPATLSHLLTHAGAALERAPLSSRREVIERAVSETVGAVDVGIHTGRPAPVEGGDTIDVTVSTCADRPVTLRIRFQPGRTPTDAELRLVKAAAHLAAGLIELETP